MYVVKQIVEEHGGTITISSSPIGYSIAYSIAHKGNLPDSSGRISS
jgi:signal transduction histidine kinase